MLCNFLVQMLEYYLKNFKLFFCPQKVEKTTPKSCILMAVGSFFLSAALTAQNSPELHYRFINSFIQSYLLRSLLPSFDSNQLYECSIEFLLRVQESLCILWYTYLISFKHSIFQ